MILKFSWKYSNTMKLHFITKKNQTLKALYLHCYFAVEQIINCIKFSTSNGR
jgi:hypothetical protein